METNPKVDDFIARVKWQKEMIALRNIMLECGLTEELKWKQPCYTYKQSNISILGAFKDHCVLSFFKGSLLSDSSSILVKPGENSQSARMVKFSEVKGIGEIEPILKAYVYEAIEIEKAGLKADFKEKDELVYPEELIKKLEENTSFKAAFHALTPGKQRGYNLYFSAPKQSKTRESRIDQMTQKILDGKGFHDCNCGQSKRIPRCDGSHKFL